MERPIIVAPSKADVRRAQAARQEQQPTHRCQQCRYFARCEECRICHGRYCASCQRTHEHPMVADTPPAHPSTPWMSNAAAGVSTHTPQEEP
jgi:hypothetical protein